MNASVQTNCKTRNQRRQKKLVQQRISGALLLILSIAAVAITAGSNNAMDHDYTALLLVIPLGLYLLFTKQVVFD